jgi:hypothetical protein
MAVDRSVDPFRGIWQPASAFASPLPMVPSNASPAMVKINSFGNAANSAPTVAPNKPITI